MATQTAELSPVPDHVPTELVHDFDLYDPPGADTDFHLAWKSLQDRAAPIVWTPRNGGHWLALRGDTMHEIYSDHEHFSSRILIVPKERGEVIRFPPTTMDPPQHHPYRALLNAGLSPRMVRDLEPDVRDLVRRTVDGLVDKGRCEFVTEFAEVLPINIFMRMVDLPYEDAPMLKVWVDELLRPAPGSETSAEEIVDRFAAYLDPWIDERVAKPGDDLLSRIVNAEVEGKRISKDRATGIGTQILLGGLDTVIATLGFVFLFLARNPGHRRQLIDDPKLIPFAVEEFLRRFGIVQNGREVVSDYTYRGVRMRAGDVVIMPGGLHGLDDEVFDDPLTVDFTRKPAIHSTFGSGVHRCPGAMLARAELRIALQEWLPRIPDFELDPDDEVRMEAGVVASVTRLPLRWRTSA